MPRVRCAEHWVLAIGVPWSHSGSRFTALFEALVTDWLKAASISAVAQLLDLSWDQVSGVMERPVKRASSGVVRRRRRGLWAWTRRRFRSRTST